MQRYIREGKVAVLVNPEFGWYTKHGNQERVFDVDVVQSVIDGHGPPGLEIEWVDPGTPMQIVRHKGREMLRMLVRGTAWITGSTLDLDSEWIVA